MKLTYVTLLALALATPALAEGNDPFTSGDSGGPRYPRNTSGSYTPSADDQRAEAVAHARETYERVQEEGGCNAPVIPFEYASYCAKDALPNLHPLGKSSD